MRFVMGASSTEIASPRAHAAMAAMCAVVAERVVTMARVEHRGARVVPGNDRRAHLCQRCVMTRIRVALQRAYVRRLAKRHGMVAVTLDELDQLCADAAVVLVAEIEAELIRVSGASS
jgi:hypothetical protein